MKNCPELLSAVKQEDQEVEEESGIVPMANVTINIIATLNTLVALGSADFIMDSGSQVSVARYEFLVDIYSSPSGFKGLHGELTRTKYKVLLYGLGECSYLGAPTSTPSTVLYSFISGSISGSTGAP